ncbi:MAG: FkbM family methyltransferase [Lewinellaceae bacterium]|nr:FkbM family methyltransferase [Phaeodactylibacter sp.]MCB9036332.1 FkbM family methyltransferase [Lewinellaceae bacterium]
MLQKIWARLAGNRSAFRRICRANGIQLSYRLQRRGLGVLREVFAARAYADYFPFYEEAVIVDVGAHFGYFSIFASLNAGPEATIISVEPSQHNYNILRRNIRDSKVENVYPIRAAIADTAGEADLYLSRPENHSLFREGDGPVETEKVRSITLDTLLQEQDLEEIDFLKLDCEGAEYPILLEAGSALLDRITTISLEFHDLKRQEYTGLALALHLKAYGFEIAKFTHSPTSRDRNHGFLIATKALL